MKRTWKNLRDGLSTCIKKRELMTRSGAAAGKLPKCKLFDQLQFLRDSVSNKATYDSTKKRQHNFDILKAFFVRHSSEYENVG